MSAGGGAMRGPSLHFFKYEVFGRVQRVWMRKYTCAEANRLGIKGWVQNTERKTVTGEACGTSDSIAKFRKWLQTKGSPKAKIEKATFADEKEVKINPFKSFEVKKVKLPNGRFWA